jgi:hypothetical protein
MKYFSTPPKKNKNKKKINYLFKKNTLIIISLKIITVDQTHIDLVYRHLQYII